MPISHPHIPGHGPESGPEQSEKTGQNLDLLADEIFELSVLAALFRSRRPAGPDDLTEAEFLTLDLLTRRQPMTIGNLQKQIGVLPAQMSRIVRALQEGSGKAYIHCAINRTDRRRVDVTLTEAGRQAHATYRTARLATMLDTLECLKPNDRAEFMRILRIIREHWQSPSSPTQ